MTDLQALSRLQTCQPSTGRLGKWQFFFQELDFVIKHQKSMLHVDADSLSRAPLPRTDNLQEREKDENLKEEQLLDNELMDIRLEMKNKNCNLHDRYAIVDHLLLAYRMDRDQTKLVHVIPRHLRINVLKFLHDHPQSEHLGGQKTYNRARQLVYWPRMKSDVHE